MSKIYCLIFALAFVFAQAPLLAAESSGSCSDTTCGSNGNSCNSDAWAQSCADSCGKSFGTTVGTTAVYVGVGVVAVVVVAAATILIIHAAKSPKEKKHKKRRKGDEDESGSLENSDLLPSRASLQVQPAL